MSEQTLSLTIFYKGWDVYQQQLVKAVTPLTSEQLALRSSPRNWSVGMLVAHIVATRVWWFHTRMGEGSADLAPLETWDEDGEPVHPAAELVEGLERTWIMIQDALDNWTPADLDVIFPSLGEGTVARSRQYIIWHVLEHDIHHSGELSSILGAHGLAAVYIG